jgi:DNA-binding CsgD family transcriptional regulator
MFPVDVVKIDKSFILGLGTDANATALVRGILSLTRALGLTAVAEGIENDVQLEALRQLGCKLAQGFFWSSAVPPEEFPRAFDMPSAPDTKALLALTSPRPQVTDQDQHLGWAVLDALPTAVAAISADGTVVATNLSWKRLASRDGRVASNYAVGTNYLAFCDGAQGQRAAEATLAGRGLRAVLAGESEAFSLEYDVGDDTAARRFLMLVSPVASRRGGAVVTHLDITAPPIVPVRGGLGSGLGPRELEVLRLMAAGMPNKVIAGRLYISLNTVRNHVKSVLHKLGAHSKLEAVATAVREGLIERGALVEPNTTR